MFYKYRVLKYSHEIITCAGNIWHQKICLKFTYIFCMWGFNVFTCEMISCTYSSQVVEPTWKTKTTCAWISHVQFLHIYQYSCEDAHYCYFMWHVLFPHFPMWSFISTMRKRGIHMGRCKFYMGFHMFCFHIWKL